MAGIGLLPSAPGLRRFAYANFINTVGVGLYLAGSALYFTRGIGLSAAQVASGLGIATAVGLAFMVPFGRLADRFGVKNIYVLLLLLQAASMFTFTIVDTYAMFVTIAVLSGVAERGVSGTAGAFIHAISEPAERVVGRAQLRTSTNAGLGIGSLLAAVALGMDTTAAYAALIAGNGVLFVLAAICVSRIPVVKRRTEARSEKTRSHVSLVAPLRDRGYMAVAVTNGVLSLHVTVLSFAMPLWVVEHTEAPAWGLSLLLVINTVLCVLFQVRVGRHASNVPAAAQMTRSAGLVLAISCVPIAISGHLTAWTALLVLVVWACVHTLGELLQTSGEFCFSFNLAPDQAQGVYQSAFGLGSGTIRALAPSLLTLVVLENGELGWVLLACLFTLSGLTTAAAASWAHRRATAPAATTDPPPAPHTEATPS
ncbi:MFS transporter [Streptomyces sp. NEAU-174]|uniref:MFS transporter n=1 Tax=Streptomyces sp. NEAU-174 TaxID=3458254 RepID=UPI0040447823